MVDLKPIYTTDNCRFSAPLMWSQTVFWREPEPDDGWLEQLSVDLEPDGIRLLSHDYVCGQSQFAISTAAHVAPSKIVQRVKGRLYHLVRKRKPQPFKGNYAIRSVGKVTRQTIEGYVSGQLVHHVMADPIVQSRMAKYQTRMPRFSISTLLIAITCVGLLFAFGNLVFSPENYGAFVTDFSRPWSPLQNGFVLSIYFAPLIAILPVYFYSRLTTPSRNAG